MARPAPTRREREEKEDPKSTRKIPKGPVIIGGIILVILITLIGFNLFGGSGASSVVIHDPVKEIGGVSFTVETASERGGSEWSGDVTLKIFYEGRVLPVYQGKVSVNDDIGSTKVDYDDFVWGNGNYTVEGSVDGKSNEQTFTIYSVAERVDIDWIGRNSIDSGTEPLSLVEATVSYDFGRYSILMGDDPQSYSFSGIITTPDGDQITVESSDYPANQIEYPTTIRHNTNGTYTLTGSAINEFCHPGSPFRNIEVESTFEHDSSPIAILGDDITTSLVDGNTTVIVDGSGSWDDSSIAEYSWLITGNGLNMYLVDRGPILEYTFSSAGSYFIELVVRDNSGKESIQDGALSSITVTVT